MLVVLLQERLDTYKPVIIVNGVVMMMDVTPDIVQVVPHEDYTVSVYFCDGKMVLYDVKPKLNDGVFKVLNDPEVFKNSCKIMNETLSWDVAGNNNTARSIDIDPDYLYSLSASNEILDV